MKKSILIAAFAAMPLFSNQAIEPQNYGPAYLYPDDPAQRLYKLPWTEGKAFSTGDGYGSEPSGSHHPDYSVDFGMPDQEPICAVRGGIVNFISSSHHACNLPGEGNKLIVVHQDSIPDSTRPTGWRRVIVKDVYYHIDDSLICRPGQIVQQGQVICLASCTGSDAGGPHLHFRVYVDSVSGLWRHLGWFDFDTAYKFASIPTPFVEVTNHPNGLTEQGDLLTSQNAAPNAIETHATALFRPGLSLAASPNPFNGGTVFSFLLDNGSKVSLEVFKPTGERVGTLVNSALKAGEHRIAWNASRWPNGVYLCRLKQGNRAASAKVLLAR